MKKIAIILLSALSLNIIGQPVYTAKQGGTGHGSYTLGDLLYASNATTLSVLGIGTTGKVLTVIGGVPTWATPTYTTPLVFNPPLSVSGNTVSISQSNSSTNGYLSSTDWNTFNGKQNALTAGTGISISSNTISGNYVAGSNVTITSNTISATVPTAYISTLTTTGTSGAATVTSGTLNIPQYQGVLSTTLPLSISSNTISVSDASPSTSGVINTTTQEIAGNKTWDGNQIYGGNITYSPVTNSSLTGANQRIPSHTTANIIFTNASLTSIASANNGAVSSGHTLIITNETGNPISIINNYSGASAGEAIHTGTGRNLTMPDSTSCWLQYDGNKWFVMTAGLLKASNLSDGTVGSGSVVLNSGSTIGTATLTSPVETGGAYSSGTFTATTNVFTPSYLLQFINSSSSTLSNGTTYYYGALFPTNSLQSTPNIRGTDIPATSIVRSVSVVTRIVSPPGTAQTSTLSLVIYDNTGSVSSTNSITTNLDFTNAGNAGNGKSLVITGLNIPITAGYHAEMKLVTPTYTVGSAPSGFSISSSAYCGN